MGGGNTEAAAAIAQEIMKDASEPLYQTPKLPPLGTKQTSPKFASMSAFWGKADIVYTPR
jgi:hypothetical protein